MSPHRVEILPLIGSFVSAKTGKPVEVVWQQLERLVLDNREIAKLKTTPGAAIQTYPHVRLNAAEQRAVIETVTAVRGMPPAEVIGTSELFRIISDGAEEETEIDDD